MKRIISALSISGFAILGWAQTNPPPEVVTPIEITKTNPVAPSNATPAPPTVPLQPVESSAVQAHDIRIVSGIKVDLGPIHDWEKNPAGDRPLKHWKKISFQTVGPMTAGQSTCRVKIEGGGEITAVVKNVPAPTAAAYANVQKLNDDHQRLAQRLEQDSRRAATVQAVQTNAEYGIPDPNQAQQAVTLSSMLQNRQTELNRLEQSVNEAANSFANISTEYAMFTGQKAKDLEIWDCGLKLSQMGYRSSATQAR